MGFDTSPILEVSGLSKSYSKGGQRVRALEGVTFVLRPGELVALMGRSGSGKTTLLNILSGWEEPECGEATWRGWRGEPTWEQVAVVPQTLGLIDELTVDENLGYPLRLSGRLQTDAGQALELKQKLDLASIGDRYPFETSLGQQQRTALGRGLVVNPKVLLADEPTTHQDEGGTASIFQLLRDKVASGACCLIATHSPVASRYADRILFLDDGRLRLGVPLARAAQLHRDISPLRRPVRA